MKKTFAFLISLCMLTAAFTACGDVETSENTKETQQITSDTEENKVESATISSNYELSDEATETETEAVTEIQDNTSTTESQDTTTEITDGTYEDVLKAYIECINNKDFKGLADLSYPEGTYNILELMANAYGSDIESLFSDVMIEESDNLNIHLDEITSAEPLQESILSMMNEMYGSLAMLHEYIEANGGYDNFDMEKLNEIMTGIDPDAAADTLNITEGYSVRFTCSGNNGEESEAEVYAYLIPGEGWKIDTSMIGYIVKSQQTSANTSAKSIYNTANAVLIDMDTEGMLIEGSCIISSDSSKNFNVDPTLADEFYSRVPLYYDDIAHYEYFAIISNSVTVSIVCHKKENDDFIGTYPVNEIYLDNARNNSIDVSSGEFSYDELYNLCLDNLQS